MRKLLWLFILFVTATPAVCQSVALSGTVTDTPDNQTWNAGTISFTFFGPQSTNYRWTGGTLNPNVPITATLSASGTYSVSVPDNSQITPTDSSWNITVCPAVLPAVSGCFKTNKVIASTGTTLNLNPPSPRFTVPLTPATISPISAYADSEISGGWVGFSYYSVTSSSPRNCTAVSSTGCTTWVSGVSIPGGSNTQVQFNNNGSFGGASSLTFNSATSQLKLATAAGASAPYFQITDGNNGNANVISVGGAVITIGPNPIYGLNSPFYQTATNCSSSASPAVCGSAAGGSVVIAAAATTVTVNTTAVTASSQILLTRDDSLGTKLSVTCNTATVMGEMKVSARTGGTSFAITVQTAPATNPGCISYSIIN